MQTKSKIGPEALEQIAFFEWIALNPRIKKAAIHIPNEGRRSWWYGKILKRMGLKAGVSDIFIAIASGEYHGLWVEMKAGKNKTTPCQKEFLINMSNEGYATAICYSATQAINTLEKYLSFE